MRRLLLAGLPLVFLAAASPAIAQEVKEPGIDDLIADLGAESWQVRTEATEALVDVGEVAIPRLRTVVEHPDPEVRRRVQEILRVLTEEPKSHLQRVLAGNLPEDLRKTVADQPVAINVSSLSIPAFTSLLAAIGQVKIDSSESVRRSTATVSLAGETRSLGDALEVSLGPAGIVYTSRNGSLYLATVDEILSDGATVGVLVDSLSSPEPDLRRRAYSLLRLLTTCRLPFRPMAPDEDRVSPLADWRAWYEENGGLLQWNAETSRFEVLDN